jgi:hypothetical protein
MPEIVSAGVSQCLAVRFATRRFSFLEEISVEISEREASEMLQRFRPRFSFLLEREKKKADWDIMFTVMHGFS